MHVKIRTIKRTEKIIFTPLTASYNEVKIAAPKKEDVIPTSKTN
jgi:hypothetical protein